MSVRKAADALPMPNTYAELALREFGATPGTREALLEGTGLGAIEPGGEITLGQHRRLIRNLGAREAPGWALRLGGRFVPASHGAVGFAAISAPTLGDGLAVVERFAHVRLPSFRLRSRHDADRFVLQVEKRAGLVDGERIPQLEMVLLSVQGLVELVLGRPMREAAIRFGYPAPAHDLEYSVWFHAQLRFASPETALAIPSQWLAQTCPTADPFMYESALRQLEVLARRLESNDYVRARVEQLIASSGGGAGLSSAEAATRLLMSERTLMRRLREAGTTYRDLLDDHRREHARALLRDPHLDITEVCHRLGYGDPANFGRACRRWFGAGPRRYRSRLQQNASEVPTSRLPRSL
jgi:AraC-like DNA-binding protein